MLDHLLEPEYEDEDEALPTEEFESWLDRCDQEAEAAAVSALEAKLEQDEEEFMLINW